MPGKAVTVGTFFVMFMSFVGAENASAQQCVAGPKCNAASAKATTYMERLKSGLTLRGGYAADAAATNSCGMEVAAEVNRACANEMRAMGREDCAGQAYAQADQFKKSAAQSRAASNAMSGTPETDWKRACGF